MKLLYCPKCNSVFSLSYDLQSCACGDVKGQYTDSRNAWFSGGIPLCFNNSSFKESIEKQKVMDLCSPKKYCSARFDAWICPANSETFVRRDDD